MFRVSLVVVAAAVFIATWTLVGSKHARLLPAAQPEYAMGLQVILDDARPKGEKRILVKDCRAGRGGNEHFCAWIAGDGQCHAGFITETPSGTVPGYTGRAPVKECSTKSVLHWLGAQ